MSKIICVIPNHLYNWTLFCLDMVELIFLGTSAMVPTKDRNQQAIFITYKDKGLLFDCGEGIQRQLKIAGISFHKIDAIFISHWHGDHVLGLPGLIQSLNSSDYNQPLYIYGPRETKKFLSKVLESYVFVNHIDIRVAELEHGSVVKDNEFSVEAYALDHNIPCLGYRFVEYDSRKIQMLKAKKYGLKEGPLIGKLQRGETVVVKGSTITPDDVSTVVPGKKIGIIADTADCSGCTATAQAVDLLISEATFSVTDTEKAGDYKHLTAQQAAHIAQRSSAQRLILTHFSQRYKEIQLLLNEARDIFPKTELAFDFMKVKV